VSHVTLYFVIHLSSGSFYRLTYPPAVETRRCFEGKQVSLEIYGIMPRTVRFHQEIVEEQQLLFCVHLGKDLGVRSRHT
jgi:hypothetical protein